MTSSALLAKRTVFCIRRGCAADHTADGRVGGGGQDRRAGLLRQMHQQGRPARVATPRYGTFVSGGETSMPRQSSCY